MQYVGGSKCIDFVASLSWVIVSSVAFIRLKVGTQVYRCKCYSLWCDHYCLSFMSLFCFNLVLKFSSFPPNWCCYFLFREWSSNHTLEKLGQGDFEVEALTSKICFLLVLGKKLLMEQYFLVEIWVEVVSKNEDFVLLLLCLYFTFFLQLCGSLTERYLIGFLRIWQSTLFFERHLIDHYVNAETGRLPPSSQDSIKLL